MRIINGFAYPDELFNGTVETHLYAYDGGSLRYYRTGGEILLPLGWVGLDPWSSLAAFQDGVVGLVREGEEPILTVPLVWLIHNDREKAEKWVMLEELLLTLSDLARSSPTGGGRMRSPEPEYRLPDTPAPSAGSDSRRTSVCPRCAEPVFGESCVRCSPTPGSIHDRSDPPPRRHRGADPAGQLRLSFADNPRERWN